jgi:ParB/RepB/Spo0J family partition protein
MEVIQVDPNELSISEFNERVETDMGGGKSELDALQASIDRIGVIQPPLVRSRNGGYEVVVGQRRTLAAQSSKDRGELDTIPVIVMDWDDGEALEASITENIDVFKEEVSEEDRARAVMRLMEVKGYESQADVANALGVNRQTIYNWMERFRPEWEETEIDPEFQESEPTRSAQTTEVVGEEEVDEFEAQMAEPSGSTLRKIRYVTGGGDAGAELAAKYERGEVTKADIEDIHRRVRRGADPDEAIQQVEAEVNEGEISVTATVKITGRKAERLREAARDRATSEEGIIRVAVEEWLDREGYL